MPIFAAAPADKRMAGSFVLGFIVQRADLGVHLLPRPGGPAASAAIRPYQFHHLPESIWLDRFNNRLNGYIHRSRRKIDFLSHLERSVRLHPAFDNDLHGIHDIHLTLSFGSAGCLSFSF